MRRKCDQCGRTFRTDGGLDWHMRHIHEEENLSSEPFEVSSSKYDDLVSLVEDLEFRVADEEEQLRKLTIGLKKVNEAVTSLEKSMAKEVTQRQSLSFEVENLGETLLAAHEIINELAYKAKEEDDKQR